MHEFYTLLLIGIGLSMDTFSVSLSIGTLKITENQIKLISTLVGIMHFIMPLIGLIIGSNLLSILNINSKYLLSAILIILALKLLKDYFTNEDVHIKLNIVGIILFAIAVSLDSLSTGIGLAAITNKIYFATTIFSICSFSFTFLGLTLGKYTSYKIGKYATIVGIIILLAVAIAHLCQ